MPVSKEEEEVTSTTTEPIRVRSGFSRYAWTVFVGLGLLMIVLGVGDMFGHPSHGVWAWSQEASLKRENSLNELLIGLFGVGIAVYALRRGDRWAWYVMLPWPVSTIAQNWRDWTTDSPGDAGSIFDSFLALAAGPRLVILIVAALALSYRQSVSNPGGQSQA